MAYWRLEWCWDESLVDFVFNWKSCWSLDIQRLQSHGDELLCWSHVALLLADSFFVCFQLIFVRIYCYRKQVFFTELLTNHCEKLRWKHKHFLGVVFIWSHCTFRILRKNWSLIPPPSPWLKGTSHWIWCPEIFKFFLVLRHFHCDPAPENQYTGVGSDVKSTLRRLFPKNVPYLHIKSGISLKWLINQMFYFV